MLDVRPGVHNLQEARPPCPASKLNLPTSHALQSPFEVAAYPSPYKPASQGTHTPVFFSFLKLCVCKNVFCKHKYKNRLVQLA